MLAPAERTWRTRQRVHTARRRGTNRRPKRNTKERPALRDHTNPPLMVQPSTYLAKNTSLHQSGFRACRKRSTNTWVRGGGGGEKNVHPIATEAEMRPIVESREWAHVSCPCTSPTSQVGRWVGARNPLNRPGGAIWCCDSPGRHTKTGP